MPYLSLAKRGYASQFDLVEVVNAILYKLKSGCQWCLLPMGHLFTGESPSFITVFKRLRHSCRPPALPLTDFSPILTQALTEIIFESHRIPTESYPTSVQTEETGLIPVRHICLMRKCIRNAGLSSALMPGWMVSERYLFASTPPYRVGRVGTSLLS